MKTQYTDNQLKQALAKMLPNKIAKGTLSGDYRWIERQGGITTRDLPILDTELLHLCWLVEETLSLSQQVNYAQRLLADVKHDSWLSVHLDWQQRTVALAKVKGVEIV